MHAQALAEGETELQLPTNMIVPWMHAHSHGPDCYLVNSGMYCKGGRGWWVAGCTFCLLVLCVEGEQ